MHAEERTPDLWVALARQIGVATAAPFIVRGRQAVGGGCINQAWRIGDGERNYFVKLNSGAGKTMFEAEAAGLAELAATATVRVPEPVAHGVIGERAYLVLEYLPLVGCDAMAMELLGRQLALLHARAQPYFGWHRDNTVGSTPQRNGRFENWPEFWRERRLGDQLDLAARHGHGGNLQRQGERLRGRLDALFAGYSPVPALLHGDLWSGNVGCAHNGQPAIFDPAVYYGDREADLAMTELFGGFPACFYGAYREALPWQAGYPLRRTLYNLYHVLNHLNVFGGGYRAQAEDMIARLLAELG